tara:strand:- start:1067 stop:1510 length:444 start_codon:yes stop_codon:yes gene_type:complete
MATIKPTLTLTANASSAATPGPLSFALSLSASDALDVTKVESNILDVTETHGVLWTAANYTASGAAGTDGAFVYIKNTSGTASHEISIGHGTAAHILGAGNTVRLMTLKGGEFAFFPWDCTADIVYDANGTYSNILESWVFVRTGTA